MRRGTRKEKKKEEDEVEQMLRAAQDEILLNLSINSHLSRPSPSSSSSTILNSNSNPDPDLDLDLERRFQALKTKSKEQGPLDLSARFDALKNKSNHSGNAAVTVSASETYEESDEEDEEVQIQKLIEWAKDAARLDPSPPSPSVSDNDDDDVDDGDDDEDDDDREDATNNKERNLKKNKSKKHLPVQLLYKKNKPIENCRKDEELARKLHRAMNSSPRISKTSPKSDSKGSRSKRPRSSSSFEITEGSGCGVQAVGQDCLSLNNGQATVGKIDSEGSNQEVSSIKKDKKVINYNRSSQIEIDNGEAESSHSKAKNCEDSHSPPIGKKRGRTKLKKLPLSICTSKDKAKLREEIKVRRSSSLTELNNGNQHVHTIPVFPVEPSTDRMIPIEATSTWKCQDFKVPACIKQNKAVQS